MTNNLIDLESVEYFTLSPNWSSNPQTSLAALRRLISFPGTSDVVQSIGLSPILSFSQKYLLKTKAEINEFYEFMQRVKGRWGRFWIRHPYSFFTLKTSTGIGAVTIYVERNQFDWIFQGYERIYIQQSDGSIITRLLTDVVENVLLDRLELTFGTQLDRPILKTDKIILGRLLLVRLDSDEIQLSMISQTLAEVGIKVVEVIKDYEDI